MPRAKPAAPEPLEPFALPRAARRRLARLLGREELPLRCYEELGACLAGYLEATRSELERKNKSAPGDAEAAIANACQSLEELVGLDSGIDAESLRILRPHARSFISAARDRITELLKAPRAFSPHELLRQTCPRLRRIFESHVAGGANSRQNLRRFVFEALFATGARTEGIDAARLERYLDAPLRR
jgi:hypothetical protein